VNWEYLQTVEEIIRLTAHSSIKGLDDDLLNNDPLFNLETFLNDFRRAKYLAKSTGWDGDYRTGHEPRVLWLPCETEFQYSFCWKQNDDGETFVVTPILLPWLKCLQLLAS
jgi:hypothetical protein